MATTDLLTLAEARAAVNVTGTEFDTDLALFVAGVSERIDALCGPVVARGVTGERHDGGAAWVRPRLVPVLDVTAVSEYTGTAALVLVEETLGTAPASAFLFEASPKFAPSVIRREGGLDSLFPGGYRGNVVIGYTAGRYTDTASVGSKFKVAAAAVLRRLWRREQTAWAQGRDYLSEDAKPSGFFRAVDPMVREFLADEVLPPAVF